MAVFRVGFDVSGYVFQTVEIPGAGITADDLAGKLNAGKILTTIQEGGTVDSITGDALGQIVDVNNFCEYSNFTVTEI